ncbi:ROK family transcriptional regulator [Microbacterium trichothecenolyticum]|uniref:NBD/HSP70 family sugar kinase n=1 Tax=Microbacterium trichothecenolyticum TaxID=69370 RepID=A0ABU0TY54_MICTR|nr:ROK family transcriptional regulator [Microbacterium trichothecenolyticum]MDQ1124597.1 putative NBD/HSP70 family sugar kinase [Microbacterium trichothecenolyticum]
MSPHAAALRDAEYAPGSVGDIFRLIRSDRATSRSALARLTGLSPSTVGIRVDTLQRLGLVTEEGEQESRGGRRAKRLRVARDAGWVAAVDVGAQHLKVALADLDGAIVVETAHPPADDHEPGAVVALTWERITEASAVAGVEMPALRGIAISLPAPIEYRSGRIVSPAFMPSWQNVSLPALFADYTDAPVLVENDANLVALAEATPTAGDHLLAVVLGTRIGSGIVAEGRLQRGFNGAAGEISHTSVGGHATISCICGLDDCLESVASGDAIAATLTAAGYDVETTTDVVRLGRTADPVVIATLREAGARIGTVLASVVNLLNPQRVVLGGTMSACAPLVAAIRAEVFARCLPIAAHDLDISAANDPATAGLRGAVKLALEESLAPARIDELAVRRSARAATVAS